MIQDVLFKPDSKWREPAGLIEIDLRKPFALDLETYDPLLKIQGPSWRYGKGHIAGVAIAQGDRSFYYPVAHHDSRNIDINVIMHYLRDVFRNHRSEIWFANATYDLGWLGSIGVCDYSSAPCHTVCDVAIAGAILEEEHPEGYSLNALSKRFLGELKDEQLLKEAASAYGIDPKAEMWKLPARYVGPYAEQDAALTLRLGMHLERIIEEEDLGYIFSIECGITPIVVAMEQQGIRFDTRRAEELNDTLLKKEKKMQEELKINVWATEEVANRLINEGYSVPKTKKGNWSCDKKFLKSLQGHTPKMIQELRQMNRLRQTFVEDAAKLCYKGRVFPQFIQMGKDDEGTVTGRMASKNPNIQQVPKRSEIGKEIRKLYLATEGNLWGKFDYSSQEPRLQVHFALACGIEEAAAVRDAFHSGKKLYTFIEEMLRGVVSYDDAKAIVLGRSYKMGIATLSEMLNKPEDECQMILDKFDQAFPHLTKTAERVEQVARTRGYIKTLCGRRRRFNYWEPANRENKAPPVYGEENAREKYGRVVRAHIRKAFNSLIQGSAADQTKMAMLRIYQDYNTIPFLQAHDELGLPVPLDRKQEMVSIFQIAMENAVPNMNIRFVADCDLAPHWQ